MPHLAREQFWSDFRVGIITFLALFLLVMGITFTGGDKGLLFKKTSAIKAHLANVGGLKKGASVTMSGMAIGKVTDIAFVDGKDGEVIPEGDGSGVKTQIEVTMEIRSDMRGKIKSDAVPAVRTQGMLGDRYVDIPIGSETSEVLPDGKILIGEAATDFDKTLHQTIDVLNETEKLLSAINEKEGTAGKFVYDKAFYNRLVDITNELNEVLKDFKKNPRRYIKLSVF